MKFGRLGDRDGELNMAWGITVDELGDVYVADWRNDRVQKFTAEGDFIFKFGKSGSGNGGSTDPPAWRWTRMGTSTWPTLRTTGCSFSTPKVGTWKCS